MNRSYIIQIEGYNIVQMNIKDILEKNVIAERINGILKQEFTIDKYDTGLEIKQEMVKNTIEIYNQIRPHLSNHMLTPNKMHQQKSIKRKAYKKTKGSNYKSLPLIY